MTMVSMEVLLSKQDGFQISDAIMFFTPRPPTCLSCSTRPLPLGLHHMQYTSCQYQLIKTGNLGGYSRVP